ncbi:hypothetical protein Scep_027758 [Stephania cephalantha]|uniref:Uncharacterized protein n=1 Tax=Stephania cephalantha TaxID=152367 RepID=A0AAP0E8P6_9MAGN
MFYLYIKADNVMTMEKDTTVKRYLLMSFLLPKEEHDSGITQVKKSEWKCSPIQKLTNDNISKDCEKNLLEMDDTGEEILLLPKKKACFANKVGKLLTIEGPNNNMASRT